MYITKIVVLQALSCISGDFKGLAVPFKNRLFPYSHGFLVNLAEKLKTELIRFPVNLKPEKGGNMTKYMADQIEKLATEKWGSLAPYMCETEEVEVWKDNHRIGSTYIVTLNRVKMYDEDRDAVLVDTEVEEFAENLYLMRVEGVKFAYCPYGQYEFRDEKRFRQFCELSEG